MRSAINTAVATALREAKAAMPQRKPVRILVVETGIPTATLNRLLNDERDISVTQLAKLADALNTTPTALLERAETHLH
jgi:transcriptional regulator with XRE-family HTH domain